MKEQQVSKIFKTREFDTIYSFRIELDMFLQVWRPVICLIQGQFNK